MVTVDDVRDSSAIAPNASAVPLIFLVKEGDDLMAATRYGIMMLCFASTKATYDKFRRPIEYPKVKYV